MKIIRTISYKKAMELAHKYLRMGREVRVGRRKGDKMWEVRIAARK